MTDYPLPERAHLLQGRISGSSGVASFCKCGRAFFGCTVAEADRAWRDHRAEAES